MSSIVSAPKLAPCNFRGRKSEDEDLKAKQLILANAPFSHTFSPASKFTVSQNTECQSISGMLLTPSDEKHGCVRVTSGVVGHRNRAAASSVSDEAGTQLGGGHYHRAGEEESQASLPITASSWLWSQLYAPGPPHAVHVSLGLLCAQRKAFCFCSGHPEA